MILSHIRYGALIFLLRLTDGDDLISPDVNIGETPYNACSIFLEIVLLTLDELGDTHAGKRYEDLLDTGFDRRR